MKRPLAVFGFSMLLISFILCLLSDIAIAVLFAGLSYAIFMISVALPKLRKGYFLPTVMLACLLSSLLFYVVQSDYDKLSSFAETKGDIVCEIKEEPVFNKEYGRYYCKAKLHTVDGEKHRGNIRLSFNTIYDDVEIDNMKIGNVLSFNGYLYKVGGEEREIVNYFKSENIYIGVHSIKNLDITESNNKTIGYYGNELRRFIADNFKERFSRNTASFLTALLTGDKTYVDDNVYDNFKKSGVAHLMAVSGMHLAVLVMLLNLFIKKLRKKHKNLYFTILSLFIIFFMFVASFSSSVVRAGVMLFVLLTGQLLDKRSDSLNSLGFACICIIVTNPFSAMSVGFLLSVLSTLAIITAAVPFCNKHRYFLCDRLGLKGSVSFFVGRAVMLSLAISISVMVYTLPVMALFFGGISLISPVANLLFLPVTTIIIVLAFISAVLCAVGFMPGLLVFIVEKISAYCLGVAELLGSNDTFILKTQSPLSIALCTITPFVLYLAIKVASKALRKMKAKKIRPL